VEARGGSPRDALIGHLILLTLPFPFPLGCRYIMSRETPDNLDLFYDVDELVDEVGDDDEEADYEYYVDADEIDDEVMEGEDEDEYADEDDDEEGVEDEDMAQATIVNDPNDPNPLIAIEGGDDEGGTTFLNLAALLNQSGGNAEARTSLLSRLLAGPASGTRGGAGLLRRLASGGAAPVSEEERRRATEERRRRDRWYEPQTEPHPRGMELLKSGEFGRVGDWRVPGRRARPRVMKTRKRGWVPAAAQVSPTVPIAFGYSLLIEGQATIPNTNGTVVACYPSIPYVGQYAGEDYSLFCERPPPKSV
jgi:WD repeat-containing protein 23